MATSLLEECLANFDRDRVLWPGGVPLLAGGWLALSHSLMMLSSGRRMLPGKSILLYKGISGFALWIPTKIVGMVALSSVMTLSLTTCSEKWWALPAEVAQGMTEILNVSIKTVARFLDEPKRAIVETLPPLIDSPSQRAQSQHSSHRQFESLRGASLNETTECLFK